MACLSKAFNVFPETKGYTQELKYLKPSPFYPVEDTENVIKNKTIVENRLQSKNEFKTESSAESGMFGDLTSTSKNIRNQLYRDLPEVIGAVVSFIALLLWIWNKKIPLHKKIIFLLLPILLTHFYLKIKHSPSPKHHYLLSVFQGDSPINTGFKHKRDMSVWPFPGSAVIKDGDNDMIFIGGTKGQNDSLLIYDNKQNKFIDIINYTNLSSSLATYSAVSFDMDNNGHDDLIVGREDGVYLYKNFGHTKFDKIKIMNMKDSAPLALSISDYNKDGKPDIYVSNFMPINKYRGTVFNDPTHMRKNILLKNISENSEDVKFVDVTARTNSGGKFNTFTSVFVDLDNDTWPDLVLSHDSGEIEILKNKRGSHFTSVTPFNGKGNWMGIGVGDIDNDGDQDLFLTNLGSDIPKDSLSLGDIKSGQKQAFAHVLLRNDGNFKFVDIIKEKGVSDKGFGWGAVIDDINLDKQSDLLFSENVALYTKHWVYPQPGHYYEQKDGKFVRSFKYNNSYFGKTPLLADVNRDGIKDIIWINMNGPANAYINKNLDKNNYLNVKLPETAEFANAKVVLDTGKKKYYREIIQGGHGFGSDQSNTASFGLGKLTRIKEVRVYTTRGKLYKVSNPNINGTLILKRILP